MSKNYVLALGVVILAITIFAGMLSFNQAKKKRDKEIQNIIDDAKSSMEKIERINLVK
ncbi:hypothetical protein NI468_12280 [Acinetobacter lwoffii]|uniref:hypothetical protein n=1 Tax=Acinetobacter lwoffii TaxID=28090 RepID=UPI002097A278|nr:hypothetical protein [Acinetobacter lwoffii]MCO8071293.1 hypothetical protein [Acinetobacter lwoffii]